MHSSDEAHSLDGRLHGDMSPAGGSPGREAFAAILNHHAELRRLLDDHLAVLRTAVGARAPYRQPLGALREFVEGSVLPHALAEEATLYEAAAAEAPLFVEGMRAEHRALSTRAGALSDADSPVTALGIAEGFAAVFAVHVDKENELLLPLLDRASGPGLAGLLRAMHDRLNEPRGAEAAAATEPAEQAELDVRALPHGGRHEMIFARLQRLRPGGRLVIRNDHDPRRLRFQLDANWPDKFVWEYLQAGPQVWRVAITRRA